MPHHLSHAFKSFTDSGFKEARIFVVDGRGSYWRLNNFNRGFETTSVYDFKKITLIVFIKMFMFLTKKMKNR